MRILLLSTFVYLIVVIVVLYIRPAFMFRADGTWKEFGLQGGEAASPFPFWLFCITWAIVSFFLSSAIIKTMFGGEDVRAVATVVATTAASTAASQDMLQPLSPPSTAGTKKKEKDPKPGYYKLNTAATKKSGVPRYIYLGPEVPDDASTSSSESD